MVSATNPREIAIRNSSNKRVFSRSRRNFEDTTVSNIVKDLEKEEITNNKRARSSRSTTRSRSNQGKKKPDFDAFAFALGTSKEKGIF